MSGSASNNLEIIMIMLILITGTINVAVKIKHSSSANLGRRRWLWTMLAKAVILIFLTPVTDLIVRTLSGSSQATLSSTQLYVVRSFKFVLVLIAFTLGIYARIYREDITN